MQELGVQIWVNYIQSMIPPEDPLRVIQEVLKRNYEVGGRHILDMGDF